MLINVFLNSILTSSDCRTFRVNSVESLSSLRRYFYEWMDHIVCESRKFKKDCRIICDLGISIKNLFRFLSATVYGGLERAQSFAHTHWPNEPHRYTTVSQQFGQFSPSICFWCFCRRFSQCLVLTWINVLSSLFFYFKQTTGNSSNKLLLDFVSCSLCVRSCPFRIYSHKLYVH